MGAAENAYYFREPMTQSYQALYRGGPVTFEFEACVDRRAYRRFAAAAFYGLPAFSASVRPYRNQGGWRERPGRRVVVKEVNPLALDWILESYAPVVVYLVRHPVAVANSYHSRGWTGLPLERMFTPASLSALEARYEIGSGLDFWERMGAFQAMVQNQVVEALAAAPAFKVVEYERLCTDPLEVFEQLFEFCGLTMDRRIREQITRSTTARAQYTPGRYDTRRASSDMADRWRSLVDESRIARVRRGYVANSPRFYLREAQW